MQQFALFVTTSPYDSRNAESAYAFCEAALALGHHVKHVFFYQSGVNNASVLLNANTDEVDMKQRWQHLRQVHGVPLYVCVSAGSRRGIISEHDNSSAQVSNVNSSFEIVGMSEYFAASHDLSIKSIQF